MVMKYLDYVYQGQYDLHLNVLDFLLHVVPTIQIFIFIQ